MKNRTFETGTFEGGHPFVRLGGGGECLVIFPALNDALIDVTVFPAYLAWFYRRLSRRYTIYVLGKRRGLPVGTTTRDMAADYAAIFERHTGPAHVMGISLGGFIAQHFAVDFPQYLKKLVFCAAAHQLGPEGMETARRWIPWARYGQWPALYRQMIDLTYTGFYRFFYRCIIPGARVVLLRKITDPDDFIISGQAALIHDGTELLARIQVPTLVIGGERDRFFPAAYFEETAGRIPNARLRMFAGVGHGVLEQRHRQADQAILEFLGSGGSGPQPVQKGLVDG